MKTRPSLQKKYHDRFRRQEAMGIQPSRASGSSASPFRPEHAYSSRPAAMDVGSCTENSTWHASSVCSDENLITEQFDMEQRSKSHMRVDATTNQPCESPPTSSSYRNLPDELAGLIVDMSTGRGVNEMSGEELAEAFRDASDVPPVTRQSLSELDIQSIITNIRLRHDVNFDRDLSFRPNLDGAKGQEKGRVAKKYWTALVAELMLYERLYHGTPSLRETNWDVITQHAQRRIPILFRMIRDVMKSLVPDRDHGRVDEHLDVPMLMQEISRGVCDLVRLAEWMAHLLKEHCAPMRDVWVDSMVDSIRSGVTSNSPEMLVEGLRGLLGILEAMKLDVANHQIRNLKTLLVEDTINFEKHYHLDRLVNGPARVDIDAAQLWYANAVEEFRDQCTPQSQSIPRYELETFVRAVAAILFGGGRRVDFPDTFYLDQDRLRTLKAEVEDLVCFDICMDMFIIVARQLGYDGTISLTSGQQLRASISAIMSEALGHGPQQWMMNSEALSLEILRQASRLAGFSQTHHFDRLTRTNQHLRRLFLNKATYHASRLEALLLPQILASAQRHSTSFPLDLFSNLVSASSDVSPPPTYVSPIRASDASTFAYLHPEVAKMTDLANRITHIIVLHWRVWNRIAYVPIDESGTESAASTGGRQTSVSTNPPSQSIHHVPALDQEPHVVAAMKTGDSPDGGGEPHVTHQTSSQQH